MKPIDIKGKKYVTVNERLIYFRDKCPDYQLISEIIELTEDRVVMKASITMGELVWATGHAYEDRDSTFINKTSFIENCETSAWGRCLANFGIGIEESVASADEVVTAIKQQDDLPWLNQAQFDGLVGRLNAIKQPEKRQELVDNTYKTYKVNRKYRNQFDELIANQDIKLD